MKRRLVIALSMLALCICNALGQKKLSWDGELMHKSSFPTAQCPTIKNNPNAYCTVLDVMLPLEGVEFKNSYIQEVKKITGGYRLFIVPTKSEREVEVRHNEYTKTSFKVGGNGRYAMVGKELYQITITPSADKNSGKAYLTLSCNVADASVRVKGDNYDKTFKLQNGKRENENLPYGRYECTFSATGYFDKTEVAVLSGPPVVSQAMLETVNGLLTVVKEPEVELIVDGISQGTNSEVSLPVKEAHVVETRWGNYSDKNTAVWVPSAGKSVDMHLKGMLKIKTNALSPTISIAPVKGTELESSTMKQGEYTRNALGTYKVDIVKKGYEPKSVMVEVGKREQKTERIHLMHEVDPYFFMEYLAGLKSPLGLSMGWVHHWGWYVSAECSWPSFDLQTEDDKDSSGTSEYKDMESSSTLTSEEFSALKKKTNFRGTITTGPMVRLAYWSYLFAGAGYGTYSDIYKDSNDKYYEGVQYKGVEAEAGVMFKIRGVTLTTRYTHLFSEKSMGDVSVGIGFAINCTSSDVRSFLSDL